MAAFGGRAGRELDVDRQEANHLLVQCLWPHFHSNLLSLSILGVEIRTCRLAVAAFTPIGEEEFPKSTFSEKYGGSLSHVRITTE